MGGRLLGRDAPDAALFATICRTRSLDRPIALPIPRNEAPSARARAIALFRDDPVAMRVSIFAFVARCLVTLRAVWHAPVIKDAAEAIGGASSGALDTGDDKLGDETIQLTAKQMIVLAGRTPTVVERGVGFKVSTPLMGADKDASYKVYFGLVPA